MAVPELWASFENVQHCIEQIDDRIAELRREKERYEAIGHILVNLMVEDQINGVAEA